MTVAALLPRLRAAGADVAERDGRLILSRASLVPADLLAEARARRADLLAELAGGEDDSIERAAIEAEHLPVRRIRKRPTSWARPEDEPQPGDYCGCCAGQLWWIEDDDPRGWRCARCHPPMHLPPGQFRALAT